MRGVPLLDRLLPIGLQPTIHDSGYRVHHRAGWLLLTPILRLLPGQYFPDRPSRVPSFPGDLSNPFLVNTMCSSDKLVLIHPYQSSPPTRVPVHPAHAWERLSGVGPFSSITAPFGGSLLHYRNHPSIRPRDSVRFGLQSPSPHHPKSPSSINVYVNEFPNFSRPLSASASRKAK